jgi:hypothetical protein
MNPPPKASVSALVLSVIVVVLRCVAKNAVVHRTELETNELFNGM